MLLDGGFFCSLSCFPVNSPEIFLSVEKLCGILLVKRKKCRIFAVKIHFI